MRAWRVVLAAGWAVVAMGMPGIGPRAANAAVESDDVCMMCHSDPDLRGPDNQSLHVDPAVLHGSVHGGLACGDCHTSATVPHTGHMAPVKCGTCHSSEASDLASSAHARESNGHARTCQSCHGSHDVQPAATLDRKMCAKCHGTVVAQYDESVHGVASAKGDGDVSTCRDCHGATHKVLKHTDPQAPTYHANVAKTCAKCHADRALVTRRKITIPEAMALYENSVHGRSKDPNAATCTDCHESHHLLRASDPRSSVYRTNIPTTCGRCHAAEDRAYQIGVHGTAVARGVVASPVCTDCHGEHLIRGPRDPNSPVSAGRVTETCSHCHDAARIVETFGLPSGRLSTYEDSYHGLAARGGSPVAADCASCHGYHDILPSSDPRSAVNPANLPKTCGSCHPGAGARFAKGRVHVALSRPDNPILFWVRIVYLVLIFGTIGGMFVHNALDFGKKLKASLGMHLGRVKAHAEALSRRYVERMTLSERIQHGLLAVSFFTLVYTGFALRYPEAWPFAWLARLEAGYAWRSIIHRTAGVVMIAVSLFHVGYLFTRRGRQLVAALLPRAKDAREAAQNMSYLAGRRDSPPRFGRFGYIEKAEYWALIWGTVVMSVTGLALWFENDSLQFVNKWVLDLATMVHYYEAWLAFLAIVVWHLYYVLLNPDVYPMNWTWLTGRINEDQLKHEHAGQWDEVFGETAGAAKAEDEASPPAGEPPEADPPAGPDAPPPEPPGA